MCGPQQHRRHAGENKLFPELYVKSPELYIKRVSVIQPFRPLHFLLCNATLLNLTSALCIATSTRSLVACYVFGVRQGKQTFPWAIKRIIIALLFSLFLFPPPLRPFNAPNVFVVMPRKPSPSGGCHAPAALTIRNHCPSLNVRDYCFVHESSSIPPLLRRLITSQECVVHSTAPDKL